MKWLREISTQYIPGVEFDGENINFRNSNLSWDEDFFTILPLTDGTLSIRVYGSTSSTDNSLSPTSNIQISYRIKGESTWTDYTFVPSSPSGQMQLFAAYVTKNITLTAGIPIELKCSTGLTRTKRAVGTIKFIYPGKISTTCPAVIMGQLESLVVGDISTSAVYGPGNSVITPAVNVPWTDYFDGLKELFKGWVTLLDASNLRMPDTFDSVSASADLTGLFSGCSNLTSSPVISVGSIYTECFKDCVSLRSVYANLRPSNRVEYTLTNWLEGTNTGERVIYVPDTLDSNYDLCLPDSSVNGAWTREIFEF